jgi:mannose-6-phosphate isomerase-like protein (cupin superfamily)
MTIEVAERCMVPVAMSPRHYRAFKIDPHDTNRIAIVCDPQTARISLSVCIEIFEVAGSVPMHRHHRAIEMFYILKGDATIMCDGKTLNLRSGDSILVPPTGVHTVSNSGSSRLYLLSIMVPNEDFIELVRNGIPVDLDETDLRILERSEQRMHY